MKTYLQGAAIAALAGAVAMASLLGVMSAAFGMRTQTAGAIGLAVPLVFISAVCGGLVALWFSRKPPSRVVAVFDLEILYLGLNGLLCLALVVLMRGRRAVLGGEAWLALPFLLVGCWIFGGVAMVPAALLIRRIGSTESCGAAV